MPSIIYKIVARNAWNKALETGVFTGAEIDITDGFIHFSAANQVRQTAARFFHGQDDLMLVGVDAQILGDALQWEPSADGEPFPHLHGPLSLKAVVSQDELIMDDAGRYQFPDHLPAD